MSRSVRSNPFCPITTSVTEKEWKAETNRALRAAMRSAIARNEPVLPIKRDVRDQYGGPKDGKQRFDPARHPELMRK